MRPGLWYPTEVEVTVAGNEAGFPDGEVQGSGGEVHDPDNEVQGPDSGVEEHPNIRDHSTHGEVESAMDEVLPTETQAESDRDGGGEVDLHGDPQHLPHSVLDLQGARGHREVPGSVGEDRGRWDGSWESRRERREMDGKG